jgi:magnesium-transporting ATPase (P-type)
LARHPCSETNLKVRSALPRLKTIVEADALVALRGNLNGEIPNTKLEHYNGRLNLDGEAALEVTNTNIVLRGCILRNTKFVHGVVVFAGKDTKLMQNSGLSVED